MMNRQLAQLASSMGELKGNSGKLPSTVHVPEKANVSKVTLRSGTAYEGPQPRKPSGEPSRTKILRDVVSEEELKRPLPQMQDPFFLEEAPLGRDETEGVRPREDPPKEAEPAKETPAQNVPQKDPGKDLKGPVALAGFGQIGEKGSVTEETPSELIVPSTATPPISIPTSSEIPPKRESPSATAPSEPSQTPQPSDSMEDDPISAYYDSDSEEREARKSKEQGNQE
ncbi:neurofilament heavy polypeptide-like [Salvia splendens]|uniref:neurofilament heavy polypeptide-like n=1 Tax=Salvia splendens TaxID=180675 RepID=UPI001C27DBA3|nr:neurofilament heavy polypeptide-like [Salvia splendens]